MYKHSKSNISKVFIKDNITLVNEDSTVALKQVDENSVDLILTDPPYNLGLFMKNRDTNLKALRHNHFSGKNWDKLPEEEWIQSMDCFFLESSRILKEGKSIIVFMSIIKVESVIKIAQKHGFYYKCTGIWHKTNPMPRNKNLHFVNSIECWLYFTYKTKTSTFNNNNKLFHDFYESSLTPMKEKKFGGHPTQKPLSILNHLIILLSNKHDVILDPFMGAGSTGVSCLNLDRSFIGFELENDYWEISKKRILFAKQEMNKC